MLEPGLEQRQFLSDGVHGTDVVAAHGFQGDPSVVAAGFELGGDRGVGDLPGTEVATFHIGALPAGKVLEMAMTDVLRQRLENRVGLFGATQPTLVKTNAGVPATASENFAYQPGKVDVTNFWKDDKNQVLMIRVKNNTDKEIEDFVLKVIFTDVRGQLVDERKIKIKKDLDEGKYIDVAVPIPTGAHKAEWNLEKINWD